MEIDPETKDVKEILRWIENFQIDYFIEDGLTKKMQNRTSMNSARLDKLLNILSQRNIISDPIKEGKKTIRFKVNPDISKKWGSG
ncbi:MAG: gamma-glutamyl phosphate reductase [Polaribacter sp.]|jgi:gamma-glutamyl phosphate reductase